MNNQIHKHPLLNGNDNSDQENNLTNLKNAYSGIEILIIIVTLIMIFFCIICSLFIYNFDKDDDPNPLAGIGFLTVGILYMLGFIISAILPVISNENEYKTKKITLIALFSYLASIIVWFL
ncbi:MAG: hypothetical protein U0W24_17115 [Bacteroidales bacterium]